MATGSEPLREPPDGFKGEVAGLGFADVIQLNAHNRFSGCLSVQFEESRGLVFFRDGDVVHAEQDGSAGEEAFYSILAWPAGQFSLQPNVATTRSTIEKGWQHLLLEGHRILDERRAADRERTPPPVPIAGAAKPSPVSAVLERVRRVPGVAQAVVQAKDGRRLGEGGYEADALAGQAAYLAMVQGQLGSLFRAGDAHSAAVQGSSRHLLLLVAKNHLVTVLARGDGQLAPVEAEVRKALSSER